MKKKTNHNLNLFTPKASEKPNAKYVEITFQEMHTFLTDLGFKPLKLDDGTIEKVYGKLVVTKNPKVTLRVYTSIAHGVGRKVGQDAIRLTLVTRMPDGTIRGIFKTQKVNRIKTWRDNFNKKVNIINNYLNSNYAKCPKCKNYTIHRTTERWGDFWGCVTFPDCTGTIKATQYDQTDD